MFDNFVPRLATQRKGHALAGKNGLSEDLSVLSKMASG
jgi:hypothetical protein